MRASELLVVDDEEDFRENVSAYLTENGWRVTRAGSFEQALNAAREREFDAALVDVMMPGPGGLDLLGCLREGDPQMEVVVVTGYGSIELAVEAMRAGAFHFVAKPVRLAELELTLERAAEKCRLARENRLLRGQIRGRGRREPPGILTRSEAMQRVLEEARWLAATDSSILLEGETGTGKELLSELIHSQSERRERGLVVVSCEALAEDLLDAELFGHEKGAFTGAATSRPGLLEVAAGGTLLFDEVGDMPKVVQTKLLRFLETRRVRRLGSVRDRHVDARVLAATHRDLNAEVLAGRFRQDLFHRLIVFRLKLPPLRERLEDILPLAGHFLACRSPRGLTVRPLAEAARDALLAHRWPGNVRELAHTMERAALAAEFSGAAAIEPEHLYLETSTVPSEGPLTLHELERRHIASVLRGVGGSRRKAAEILGLSERQLYRRLRAGGTAAGQD